MDDNKAFVSITPQVKDGRNGMYIEWGFTVVHREEEDGRFSCYIPSFDIYFSAKDQGIISKKAKAITKMYVDHYIVHAGKNTLRNFILQLKKRGFKTAANDAMIVKRLITNEIVKAKFNSVGSGVPEAFLNAPREIHESNMEMAF